MIFCENQERLNTPQTLHAVVSGDKNTANVQPSNISISNTGEKNNSKNAQNFDEQTEQFSYTPQNDKIVDVFERIRSGELSIDDGEKLLVNPEGDNPATIASLKKEEMGSTPKINKKTNGNAGGGDSKFADSVQRSSIFNEEFKKEVGEDSFVKHYAAITNKETLAEAASRLDQGGEAYVNKKPRTLLCRALVVNMRDDHYTLGCSRRLHNRFRIHHSIQSIFRLRILLYNRRYILLGMQIDIFHHIFSRLVYCMNDII